jgi:hypothetical protein
MMPCIRLQTQVGRHIASPVANRKIDDSGTALYPELDHFFATGFKVMNGEPGHFHFEPVPDNAWQRANHWGKSGSKPLAKGGRK